MLSLMANHRSCHVLDGGCRDRRPNACIGDLVTYRIRDHENPRWNSDPLPGTAIAFRTQRRVKSGRGASCGRSDLTVKETESF